METLRKKTRVLIADDHPATREGIRMMLEREDIEVVAQACDGVEAIELFHIYKPTLILMDLHMPRMDGLSAALQIRRDDPRALIVILTSYEGDIRVSRALEAGARSYILKTSNPKEFSDNIRRVLEGDVIVDPALLDKSTADNDHLTAREVSVIELIAQGVANKDIGRELNVTEHTIKARVKSILAKLDAKDRSHAVTIARDRGYIDT